MSDNNQKIVQRAGGTVASAAGQAFGTTALAKLQETTDLIEAYCNTFGLSDYDARHLKVAFFYMELGSGLIPDVWQGNLRGLWVMSKLADQMKCDLVELLQGGYIVYGKWAWSADFMIKRAISSGFYTSIEYETGGKLEDDTLWCRAIGTRPDGTKLIGTTVSVRMARAEGWFDKKGSKWQTMPALMLKKRAATFLIRETAPHVFGGGYKTDDEMEDIHGREGRTAPLSKASSAALLQGVLEQSKVIDAEQSA